MSSLPYAEVKRIREAVTARVAREGKARGMDLSVRTRNVLRKWLCDNGVDALLPEPDELRIVMGCGDATAKEYSLWIARKPEPTREELLEERDAARREVEELKTQLEHAVYLLRETSRLCCFGQAAEFLDRYDKGRTMTEGDMSGGVFGALDREMAKVAALRVQLDEATQKLAASEANRAAESELILRNLTSACAERNEARREAGELKARVEAVATWTHRYGSDLKPLGGCADTFGEGMRAAKMQVSALLAPPPERAEEGRL